MRTCAVNVAIDQGNETSRAGFVKIVDCCARYRLVIHPLSCQVTDNSKKRLRRLAGRKSRRHSSQSGALIAPARPFGVTLRCQSQPVSFGRILCFFYSERKRLTSELPTFCLGRAVVAPGNLKRKAGAQLPPSLIGARRRSWVTCPGFSSATLATSSSFIVRTTWSRRISMARSTPDRPPAMRPYR